MDGYQILVLTTAIITQVVSIFGALFVTWRFNHNKKKYIKEQIACHKREIWDIQKQITSIVASGDKALINSEYVQGLAKRLKQLKSEIANLNGELKPKEQDKTKLNVTESIKMLQETIDKLGGKK